MPQDTPKATREMDPRAWLNLPGKMNPEDVRERQALRALESLGLPKPPLSPARGIYPAPEAPRDWQLQMFDALRTRGLEGPEAQVLATQDTYQPYWQWNVTGIPMKTLRELFSK